MPKTRSIEDRTKIAKKSNLNTSEKKGNKSSKKPGTKRIKPLPTTIKTKTNLTPIAEFKKMNHLANSANL
jgi:hypothetical protein